MGTQADPGDDPRKPETMAESLVRDLTRRWDARGEEVDQLLDRVSGALADEANHELRQILTLVSTELELAERRSKTPGTIELDTETFRDLMETLERGTGIVATYLDRNEVAKLLLQLHVERFDVDQLIQALLSREGLDPDVDPLDVSIDKAPVVADREKVGAVLAYLVSRFSRSRPDGSTLEISVQSEGEGVRGFIGLHPAPFSRGDLVEKLEANFNLDDIGIDIPYSRALIERHGGSLFVDEHDGALGYGFRLPPQPPGGDGL